MADFISCKRSLYDINRSERKRDVLFCVITSVLLLIIAAIMILNGFVFVKIYVYGKSMNPTLQHGEVVLLNSRVSPTYGDIVVISDEKTNGDWLVKRAIAFGGDTVKIEGGYVFLKKAGETEFNMIDEPYLRKKGITYYPIVNDRTNILPHIFYVPEGEVFYLGDNRTDSSDSRSEYGTCNTTQIKGVVSDFALNMKGITTFFGRISEFFNSIFGVK